MKNIKVELWRNGNLEQQTFSRPDGTYTFDVNMYDTFQIKIDASILPFYVSCSAQKVLTSIISSSDSTDINMNSGMQCKTISDDIAAQNILTTRHRPGRTVTVNLHTGLNNIYGYSCSNSNLTGKIKLFKAGSMKFLNNNSYSITPTLISMDSLIWNVADFNSFTPTISFLAQVDTQAQIGQSVCYQLIVEHNFTDNNHNNDTLNLCFPIFNGYDPNEKSGRLNVVDSTITYAVQFQNTGNDTAQHIIVKDTLSNDLGITSLEILNHSFQPFTQTFGNVVVFNFPNINLVDSTTNEQGSHGFITFKVKIKSGTSSNSIQNRAAIYFDFNPPIYTNISNVNLCYHPSYSYFSKIRTCPNTISFNSLLLNSSGIYFDTLQNYVGCDSFITLHLIVNPISSYSYTQNICIGSSYTFNGNNLTTAGIYFDTLQNYVGCDSFITLHLNVNQSTSKTFIQTICNNQTYNLNGTILNQTGTYYDTIQNHFGCDSFITLHLIVNPISSYSFNKIICSNQFCTFNHLLLNSTGIYYDTLINHNGCDSFITLHLTVLPSSNKTIYQTICSNNPFLFNGNLLTQTGKYYDTLTNYVGCDSIVTLRLTALPSYLYNSTTLTICEGSKYYYNGHVYTTNTQLYDTFTTQLGCDSIVGIKIIAIPAPDTSVIQSNNLLIAQAQHSSFYWYDCTQKQLIQNANDDSFTVHHSGSYAVLVQDSVTLCSDTSNCRTVIVSGVGEQLAIGGNQLTIFPNPCGEKLLVPNVRDGYSLLGNTIEVMDVLGRTCIIPPYKGVRGIIEIDVSKLPQGIYFIKATDIKGNMYNAKFVKE